MGWCNCAQLLTLWVRFIRTNITGFSASHPDAEPMKLATTVITLRRRTQLRLLSRRLASDRRASGASRPQRAHDHRQHTCPTSDSAHYRPGYVFPIDVVVPASSFQSACTWTTDIQGNDCVSGARSKNNLRNPRARKIRATLAKEITRVQEPLRKWRTALPRRTKQRALCYGT